MQRAYDAGRGDDTLRQTQAMITRLLQASLEPISLNELLDDALLLIISVPWITLASSGCIHLYDDETDSLFMVAEEDLPPYIRENYEKVSVNDSHCQQSAFAMEMVQSSKGGPKDAFVFVGMKDCGHCCIPLFAGDKLLGMLTLFAPDDYQPNPTDASFIRAFASTLGEIIKRFQNEEKLVRSRESDEIIKMLLESAIEPVPLQDQLDQVITMLFYLPWLPVQAKGVLFLADEESDGLFIKSYTDNFRAHLDKLSRLSGDSCICGRPVSTEVVIHGPGVSGDENLDDLNIPGVHDCHCVVPILEEGKLTGIMVLYLEGVEHLGRDNVGFLRSVASVLSIIIVRKRLDARLVQALTEQRLANERLDRANVFIRKTFGSYMSDEVANSILDTPEGLLLGDQEKMVTVLMSDLRGFTAMSERMSPGEVLTMLNLYLGEMTDILQEYKGTIIEFLGDGILAHGCGYQYRHGDRRQYRFRRQAQIRRGRPDRQSCGPHRILDHRRSDPGDGEYQEGLRGYPQDRKTVLYHPQGVQKSHSHI